MPMASRAVCGGQGQVLVGVDDLPRYTGRVWCAGGRIRRDRNWSLSPAHLANLLVIAERALADPLACNAQRPSGRGLLAPRRP